MVIEAIFGGGGFGREVKTIIDKINEVNPNTYNFIGFYDDGIEKGEIVNGYPVLGGLEDVNNYKEELNLVISIGDPKIKTSILNKISNPKINYPCIIHPNTKQYLIAATRIVRHHTYLHKYRLQFQTAKQHFTHVCRSSHITLSLRGRRKRF